jgi:hypothetical protein
MISGQVLEITFINDHKLLHSGVGFGNVGAALTGPHWVKDGVNHPVTYTQGTTISIKVKVKVQPAGAQYKLFGIDKKQMFFNFESPAMVATGAPQTITLKAKAPLPRKIEELSSKIIWNAATIGAPQQWANLGATGEHAVYALLAKPIVKNSMGYSNNLTVNRIQAATRLASGLNDVNRIAVTVQTFVNGHTGTLGTGYKVTVNYGSANSANQLWRLLDDGTSERGHCGEASYLMEQILRLLGIRAVQKHVYGRTSKAAFDKSENLTYEDEATGKLVGKGPQVRDCKVHGEENLWLNFSSSRYSLNAGEGTVEVNGKLYGGLVNEIGEKRGGITASHDLLLKLEKKLKPKFQVWSSDAATGCGLPAGESLAGDPFPPVPSP